MLRRRDFFPVLGAAIALWPYAVRGQPKAARIAVLMGTDSNPESDAWVAAFRQKLRELGRIEGSNIQIDLRWGRGDIERIRVLARQIVSTRPDVIVCFSVRVAKTVKALIRDIPIVFIATSDPVAQGLVESYNHPGGNLTGFTLYEYSVTGKLVELVKEVAPGVTRVALLFNPENTSAIGYLQTLKRVTPRFQLALVELAVRDATTIENAVSQFAADPNGALLLPPDVTTRVYRDLIIGLAAKYKLPAVYTSRADAKAGGLMAYGPDLRGQFRGAAVYVDRILKGEMAANLPIQAPTDYALIVNMMTARNLGVSIPESVLFRATEVIE